jgi:hypothetical protein
MEKKLKKKQKKVKQLVVEYKKLFNFVVGFLCF